MTEKVADATDDSAGRASAWIADQCSCFHARRFSRTLTRYYDQHLAASGLRTTQFSLLQHIRRGENSMQSLSQAMGMDRTTLTRNLRPLEAAGLISIGRSEVDGRQRRIALTEPGLTKLRLARSAWRTAQSSLEAICSKESLEALHQRMAMTLTQLKPHLKEAVHV